MKLINNSKSLAKKSFLFATIIFAIVINAKRFSFSNPSRIITLSEDLTDADFVADSK